MKNKIKKIAVIATVVVMVAALAAVFAACDNNGKRFSLVCAPIYINTKLN